MSRTVEVNGQMFDVDRVMEFSRIVEPFDFTGRPFMLSARASLSDVLSASAKLLDNLGSHQERVDLD